jgi:hypothetical protein
MPTETTKGTERCELHPGSVSVARCARCDRTLCIACAVPVRGVVLGPECLPADVVVEGVGAAPRRRPRSRWWLAVGAALAILLGSTAFPWTLFGTGSGWFGAWGFPLRWSTLTALSSLGAFLTWLRHASPGSVAAWVVASLAITAAGGAELAISNPPPFTKASVAPWVALAAGVTGAALAAAVARRPSD